jgi:hypothetical protein
MDDILAIYVSVRPHLTEYSSYAIMDTIKQILDNNGWSPVGTLETVKHIRRLLGPIQ